MPGASSAPRRSALLPAWLRYTVLRAFTFLAVFGVLWVAFGERIGLFPVALAAVLVSGILSLLAFRRQREEVAGELHGGVERIRRRIDTATTAEDHDDPPPP